MLQRRDLFPPDLEQLPEIQIPEGYAVRSYRPGDEIHWARIIDASFGGNRSAEDVKEEIVNKPQFTPEGLFFATCQGEPVGTACAWRGKPEETEVGQLHMVGVEPEHQGHRLGKLVSICVLHFLKKHSFSMAMLDTDDERLPAVKTYLNLGFRPVYRDDSHPGRWKAVSENLGIETPEPFE